MTRNVTMAFEDEVIDRLRIHAAQNQTTVNAIFRNYAEELLGLADKRKAARERMLELSRLSEAYDAANPASTSDDQPRLSRDETYSGRRFDWPRKD
jgi:uncharacterized protein with von Willebrand factor type A (vWA) domain